MLKEYTVTWRLKRAGKIMKNFLRFIFCFFVVNAFGVEAMDWVYDYNSMYRNTCKESKVQEISTIALSAGEITDESEIREAAFSGDYVAQYLLAQQAGGKARSVKNGEQRALLKEKAIFLSISAIRGGYWKSIEEINSILPKKLNVSEYEDFSAIQRLVDLIYKDL